MPIVSKGFTMTTNAERSLDGERVPTTTARVLGGVAELEALKHERLFVVKDAPREVNEALFVHDEAHAVHFVAVVARLRLPVLELDDVGESRATAALDPEADGGVRCAALLEFFATETSGTRGDLEPRFGSTGEGLRP